MKRLYMLKEAMTLAIWKHYTSLKWTMDKRVRQPLVANKGLGSIELIVLIMVLVGLALLFKDRITAFLTDLTDQMSAKDIMNETKKR